MIRTSIVHTWWIFPYIFIQYVWNCPFCVFKGHMSEFLNFYIFLSSKILLFLANSTPHDEMLHYATFHLGLHCLPKYLFAGFQNEKRKWVKRVSFNSAFMYHNSSSLKYNKYIHKIDVFIKEMDTFGYIVVWTIYTSHFTSQHAALNTRQHAYQSFMSHFLVLFRLQYCGILGEF